MTESGTRGRQDCAITIVSPPDAADCLGEAEMRALRVLADAGLVPPLPLVLAAR